MDHGSDRELVRRMAPAGQNGRIEIEHDREQRPIGGWGHDRWTMSDVSRFDPPELLATARSS